MATIYSPMRTDILVN